MSLSLPSKFENIRNKSLLQRNSCINEGKIEGEMCRKEWKARKIRGKRKRIRELGEKAEKGKRWEEQDGDEDWNVPFREVPILFLSDIPSSPKNW